MNPTRLIYILDSDHSRLKKIQTAGSGLAEVRAFGDYRSFEFELKRRSPHLVCVGSTDNLSADRTLISVCESAEVHKYEVYAFVSRLQEQDRIRAFELGVQDLIVEPCESAELRARLQRTLRKCVSTGSAESIHCSNLQLWPLSMRAELAGRALELSALEYRLLEFFVTHKDEALTRSLILRDVWKDVHVSARTIDSHVALLRKKLAAFKGELETIYGVGYALRPEREVAFAGDCDRISTCPHALMARTKL